MGMFDNIEHEQVKCFYSDLCTYKIGDTVPGEEFNYGKNFLILITHFQNISNFSISNLEIAIIKDSKLDKIKTISQLENKDFENIDSFILYQGHTININSLENLLDFLFQYYTLDIQEEIQTILNKNTKHLDSYEEFNKKWLKKEAPINI